jgi:transcriptional regulator with PAS, ATPase and Fis domain
MRGQSLMLRVLQEREYRRLGESSIQRADFRLISASHKRLECAVKEGAFRGDLFFRLKVVNIDLPPLRKRIDDILPLAQHFLMKKSAHLRLAKPALSSDAKRALAAYAWPGNVRELENEMVQSLLRIGESRILEVDHLSSNIRGRKSCPLHFASRDFEKRYLEEALSRHRGNRTRTARFLGLTRQALYNKLKKHGLLMAVREAS